MDIWSLTDLATPWAVHVAVTLRVAEHIAAGRTRIEDIAAAAGAHTESLHRVLRHLVEKGVFEETSPGTFGLNEPSRKLLEPPARLGMDLDGFGGRMAHAWGTLLTAVRTGAPAYHEVFGRPFWNDLESNPKLEAEFDEMIGPPGHGTPDPDVLVSGGWESIGTVVDVGGGTGALLAEILKAHPSARGILVDRPSTVARSAEIFARAGVSARVTTRGQSFFDALPPGGDLYLLKNVLSDWPDDEARTLLARCAEAARPRGRVVAVSGVSPDDRGAPSPELLMLVLVGGKGRTLTEFRALAQSAGLDVHAAGRTASGRFVVECRPR